MKILLAEDDPVMRHLVATLLKEWDYDVINVEDGEQALRELERDSAPRLAILDWQMPGISGVDVVRELRAKKRDAYTYVLLLTAEAEKGRLLEALRFGCDDYITKPFDSQELQARLFVGSRIVRLQEQLAQALDLAQYKGNHDALTGVLNRAAVLEEIEREFARSARSLNQFSVMLLDVDHFKRMNDMFGHLVGDEALVQVAQRLSRSLRQYDVVGRYGGEEFVAVLPDCSLAQAVEIAERVCEQVRNTPFVVGKREVQLTVSIGVASAQPGWESKTILRVADQAMYRAKAAGRNQVCRADVVEGSPTDVVPMISERSTQTEWREC